MGDGTARAGRRLVFVLALVSLAVLIRHPVARYLRAGQVLLRFTDRGGPLATLGAAAVVTREVEIEVGGETVRARRYAPRGRWQAPGLVLLHGMHRLGIDEPRVVRLARAMAAASVVVLTPEIGELTRYRVEARSVETIGAAARWLAREVARVGVGVVGVSFAGGLALVAAADPAQRDAFSFVLAIGAHHDLGRVSRFFVRDAIERPDGRLHARRADRYGLAVLVHAYAEAFFDPEDVRLAREAIERSLAGDTEGVRAAGDRLTDVGRAMLADVLARKLNLVTRIDERVRDVLAEHATELAAASPHGKLEKVKVPVFLLHASGDDVVPPTETSWIARETRHGLVRRVLISPVLGHAEIGGSGSVRDRLVLVSFLAEVLQATSAEPVR